MGTLLEHSICVSLRIKNMFFWKSMYFCLWNCLVSHVYQILWRWAPGNDERLFWVRSGPQLGLVSRTGSIGGALRLCQSPSTRVASKKCQFSKRVRKKKEKGVVFFCIVSLGSQVYVSLRSCDIGCAKAWGRMCSFAHACVPFAWVVARSISSTNKFAARPCCKKQKASRKSREIHMCRSCWVLDIIVATLCGHRTLVCACVSLS